MTPIIQYGIVQNAVGSCYYEFKNTQIVVTLYSSDRSNARLKFYVNNDKEERSSTYTLLRNAIDPIVCWELYPRTTFHVYCKLLEQNSKHALDACVNAISLCFLNSGVSSTGLVFSASRYVDNSYYNLCLQPVSMNVTNVVCRGRFDDAILAELEKEIKELYGYVTKKYIEMHTKSS